MNNVIHKFLCVNFICLNQNEDLMHIQFSMRDMVSVYVSLDELSYTL